MGALVEEYIMKPQSRSFLGDHAKERHPYQVLICDEGFALKPCTYHFNNGYLATTGIMPLLLHLKAQDFDST